MTLHFPSPRPSPLGRGRTFRRFIAVRSAVCVGGAFEQVPTAAGCSLSPRERVRARGNTVSHVFAPQHQALQARAPRPLPDYCRPMATVPNGNQLRGIG